MDWCSASSRRRISSASNNSLAAPAAKRSGGQIGDIFCSAGFKPALSRISKSASALTKDGLPTGKSAIQQVWKPALRHRICARLHLAARLLKSKVGLFGTGRIGSGPIKRRVHELAHLGEPPLGLGTAFLAANRATPLSRGFECNFKLFFH